MKPSRRCWPHCTCSRVEFHHIRICSSFAPARWRSSVERCKTIKERTPNVELPLNFYSSSHISSSRRSGRDFVEKLISRYKLLPAPSSGWHYCAISLPLDNVRQPPGILVKLELQLTFLIDDELRGREKNTFTLVLVFII